MSRLLEKKELDRYDPSPVQGSISLLQVAWKRKPLIALGAVLGLLVGWVYFLQRPAVYESSAQIKVERTFASGPVQGFEGSMVMYEDYLATQMQLIQSQRIIKAAVKAGKLNELPSFAGQDEAATASSIRGSFNITRIMQQTTATPTNFLTLSFRGPNSEDCATVLNQIIQSYEDYLKDDRTKTHKKSFEELVQMHDKLEEELVTQNDKLRKMRELTKIIRTEKGGSVELEILRDTQTRRANIAVQLAETRMRLNRINDAVAKGEDPTDYLDLTPEGSKFLAGPGEETLERLLAPLFVQEATLLERFGSEYFEVKDVRAKIKAQREVWIRQHPESGVRLPAAKSGTGSAYFVGGLAPQAPGVKATMTSAETVATFVKSLKAQVVAYELREQALTKLADDEAKKMIAQGSVSEDEDTLRKDIEDKRELARSYRKRMDEVSLVGDRGGIVTDKMAEPGAGYQVEPKATPIILAALLGGLLLGVGLAWLAEATDQSFRNPEDIRRRLKVQVLGHLPRITATEEEKQMAEQGLLPLDPSICAFYQPKSVDAEAFRGLRTTLFFKLEGQGHKVIQITSPNMGDGKTTLATNLAVSIAQSGKRILLIDADFRRPRLHKMFNLDATTGLASVIAEGTDVQDAIKPTPVPNLSLLPCGPRPSNPAELLTSKRFLDLLDVLREQFDIILVDTPPLLAVSDPSVVAPRVDGVLLTIRVAKNGRPAAERAREILANLGANVYGVVVNGIDGAANQGYGASQYGYSYHYAYGYTYEAADNSSYYHDDEDAAPKNGTPDATAKEAVAANGAAAGTNGKASRNRRSRRRRAEKSSGLIRWLREALWH
jgi:succinoglycan biosynthesis transport protein ExoP